MRGAEGVLVWLPGDAVELCRAAANVLAVGKARSMSTGMPKVVATAAAARESPPTSTTNVLVTSQIPQKCGTLLILFIKLCKAPADCLAVKGYELFQSSIVSMRQTANGVREVLSN